MNKSYLEQQSQCNGKPDSAVVVLSRLISAICLHILLHNCMTEHLHGTDSGGSGSCHHPCFCPSDRRAGTRETGCCWFVAVVAYTACFCGDCVLERVGQLGCWGWDSGTVVSSTHTRIRDGDHLNTVALSVK